MRFRNTSGRSSKRRKKRHLHRKLEGPALPALRKLTIDGNIPPTLSSRTRSRRPHTAVEGEASHCFLPAIEAEEENGMEDALACDDGGQMAMQATLDIPEPKNRRQAMESPEWDEWRKAEETEMLGMVENCDDMAAIGFEQAKADPCMLRKVVDGEAEMVVVVHVDDILAHTKNQATMDRFTAELGQKFKLKDMGDAGYYMGCHITRNRKARE